jgi:hypothetical protein
MRMEMVHTGNGNHRSDCMQKKEWPWTGGAETEASGREQTSQHDDSTIYNDGLDNYSITFSHIFCIRIFFLVL